MPDKDKKTQQTHWLLRSNCPYVKPEQEKYIREHKYVGSNESIYYHYFLVYICDFIVNNLPVWLAPNLITFFGFLCNLVPHAYMIYKYGWGLQGELSAEFCYVIGLSYQMYIIADNCDGKQARRTGSSSPMGMLFDHGVDAFVALFNNFMLLRLFSLPQDPYQPFIQMIAIFPFYFVTLEQYYTGEMNFPPINGVDEGSVVITLCAIITGYFGNVQLWEQIVDVPYFGEKPLNFFTKWGVAFFVYLYALSGLMNIYLGRHLKHFKEIFQLKYFVAQVFFFFFALFTSTMSQVYSQVDIWKTHPRSTFCLFGAQFAYVVLRLQYSHIICAQVNPFRRTILLVWGLQWLNIYNLAYSSSAYFDEHLLLYFCLFVQWSAICHQIFYSLKEFKKILNISIFTIKPKMG